MRRYALAVLREVLVVSFSTVTASLLSRDQVVQPDDRPPYANIVGIATL